MRQDEFVNGPYNDMQQIISVASTQGSSIAMSPSELYGQALNWAQHRPDLTESQERAVKNYMKR